MSHKKMHLRVISQEAELLSADVESITLPTTTGDITVLPGHEVLFSQVQPGHLVYRDEGMDHSMVVSDGFIDFSPGDKVTVMVDSGILARNVSVEKAQQAIADAQETMSKTQDQRELMMAEASLRQAMLEIKLAQKTHKSSI